MKLICIGSESLGNCYILDNGQEALVIEAGLRPVEVKKALKWNISNVRGVIISHEHL